MSNYYSTVDIFDGKGHLLRIEAYDGNGELIIQGLWDPTDEQTADNRAKFREWFAKHVERKLDEGRG
jgi:hypothetical protein